MVFIWLLFYMLTLNMTKYFFMIKNGYIFVSISPKMCFYLLME